MNLNNIDENSKEILVVKIGEMYRDSLILAKQNNQHRIEEKEGIYKCLEMKYKIDGILNDLRLEYAFIIQKDFLEENSGKWYLNHFDDEEYLMYKKGAIDTFLHCLYG